MFNARKRNMDRENQLRKYPDDYINMFHVSLPYCQPTQMSTLQKLGRIYRMECKA